MAHNPTHEQAARELAEQISTNTDALSNDRIRDEGVRMITEALTTSYAAGFAEARNAAAKKVPSSWLDPIMDEQPPFDCPTVEKMLNKIRADINALTPPAAKDQP